MIPRATYRLQFHRDFTFADGEALVPYLHDLGISHVYASPITTARSGSIHGYDVVDPTRINPELGGEDAFRSLVAALRARDMGVIIDIVPNHMGVAGGENGWWNDVLAHGPSSPYARFFDIDWNEKLVLPILGEPLSQVLADGALAIEAIDGRAMLVAYGEHRLPIRPEDQSDTGDLRALIDRQHYRLASWRTANDDLNWRRFFTINDLAGLCVEDPQVFEATHALYFRLYEEGLIDGVRVDHVDGLTDPAGYCRTLRARFDAIPRERPAYIVIEKILGTGEALASDWGVDGTSGYDFMEQVTALLHDPEGAEPLGTFWADISGRSEDFGPEELRARQEMLSWQFDGQLRRCVESFADLAASTPSCEGMTQAMLRRAIERLLWVFPVYRTYGLGHAAPDGDVEIRRLARERVVPHLPPGEGPVVDLILSWLAGEGPGDIARAAEAVRRFQQLSAPIAAKAVEDTAFYRHGRLISRNDVGFDAGLFAGSIADFHAAMADRAANWPNAMLATATHDHKRGEDARARLAVLSEIPGAWRAHVERWMAHAVVAEMNPGDAYMALQTIFGAWPLNLSASDVPGLSDLADRVADWQTKALREAKLRSSWEDPDLAYEARCNAAVRALLTATSAGDLRSDMVALLDQVAAAAEANSLVQIALRCTVPGMPDLYQGTELSDLSLVDPDNRRPVAYSASRAALAAHDHPKMALIARLLGLRKDHPGLFGGGGAYDPIDVIGPRAGHVLAFSRSDGHRTLRCAVALRTMGMSDDWWGETALATGEAARNMFGSTPVWVEVDG